MRAVVWHRPQQVSVDEVPDPQIQAPTDAVIRVTATAICGSDLHLYDHGLTMAVKPGDILGHEPMGVVEEVGTEVRHLRPGDTVVVPFNISCGSCFMCSRLLYSQCETTQNWNGRKGGSLFGYTHLYGGIPGGQAQYLRVPQAHFGPVKVGEAGDTEVSERAALLLSDVLPTAWQGVKYADVPPEGTLAVYGLGPVGQMAVRIARHLGAGRVIGIDPNADRREVAARHGAEVLDPGAGNPAKAVKELTGGRGADAVLEAVGMDAEGSVIDRVLQTTKLQPDRLVALHQALGSVRRGGTVSVSGVYAGWFPRFPLGDLFDKQVTLRWGQANVRRWTDDILEVLRSGDPIRASELVSHEQPLEEAPQWYQAFRDKIPGVVKVLLRP
ncbi:MAG: glutathione-dependent formaldehyde dehydrogenase [Actinomycetota bacterium]|nr:glutathione-dependent formaldehyde dehydrogenase [Actinomycetota bacterium]